MGLFLLRKLTYINKKLNVAKCLVSRGDQTKLVKYIDSCSKQKKIFKAINREAHATPEVGNKYIV